MPLWAVVGAIILLSVVVVEVRLGGPLVDLDHRIAARVGAWDLRGRPVRRVLTAGVWFGQRGVVLTGAALVAVVLTWRTRSCEPVLRLLIAVVSLAVVVYGFKDAMARNAPVQQALGVAAGHGTSFPSGHIANAILLWGWADWSVRTWPCPQWLRRAIRAGRWVAPFAVFVAMTLLNYHWLSDFLGGAAVGVILLAVDLWSGWTPLASWIDARAPAALTSPGRFHQI